MMEPTKKTTAKKTVAKKKTAEPVVSGTDEALVALGRHLHRDHRWMEQEVRIGLGLKTATTFPEGNDRWRELWKKIK